MVIASPPTSVVVLGGTRLFADSVQRVLLSSGFGVGDGDHRHAAVVVLVEPGIEHWRLVETLGVPAVVLTSRDVDGDAIADLVIRGAEAVLPLDADSGTLVDAVARVAAGHSGLTRAQTRLLTGALRGRGSVSARADIRLTPREAQILRTIDAGLSVKQTARQLGISPRTVENTQRVLYRKLAVRNRAQAVATAYRLNLLPGDAP
jgi:DNA-binding NarL/FixJ family response regulator